MGTHISPAGAGRGNAPDTPVNSSGGEKVRQVESADQPLKARLDVGTASYNLEAGRGCSPPGHVHQPDGQVERPPLAQRLAKGVAQHLSDVYTEDNAHTVTASLGSEDAKGRADSPPPLRCPSSSGVPARADLRDDDQCGTERVWGLGLRKHAKDVHDAEHERNATTGEASLHHQTVPWKDGRHAGKRLRGMETQQSPLAA